MKKYGILKITAWILVVLAALMLTACGDSHEYEQGEIVYITRAPRTNWETEATVTPGRTGTPDTQASETPAALTATPDRTATPVPTPTPSLTPIPGKRLADGEYEALIYSNMMTDDSGCVWVTVGELKYQELPNNIISIVEVGDVITLHSYSFEVLGFERTEKKGVPMILFNDGTECCKYIEETDSWRFIWPDGEPYTYEAGQYLMPIAIDASLTDELTPYAEGQNVYGAPYSKNDPTVGILDDLADYFRHYRGLDSEYACITVAGGEITSVLIEYHP